MLRVGGRECVFKLAESAHICCESRLRDALSVRHATPSAQALVLPHEDMDAPRPSVCRVDEDARRQRRATQGRLDVDVEMKSQTLAVKS